MIKRFIEIENTIKFKTYNQDEWELLLKINRNDAIKLLLEMHLLEYSLAQIVSVKSKTTSEIIAFSLSENPNEKISTIEKINNKLKISLLFINLQYLISFLLRYYRDSHTPTNHIHLDISEKSPLGKSGDVIIETEDESNPLSGEELEKLLKNV